nr:hypothetical protein [Allomuricauda sp.]
MRHVTKLALVLLSIVLIVSCKETTIPEIEFDPSQLSDCPDDDFYVGGVPGKTEYETFYTSCTSINGNLTIRDDSPFDNNIVLRDLNFLNKVETIDGDLKIFNTDELAKLDGLSSLTSIEGSLIIDRNLALESVDIPNLVSIGGDLIITSNATITELSGLDKLNSIGGDIIVRSNFNLATCIIESFCIHRSENKEIILGDNLIAGECYNFYLEQECD